MDYGFKLNQKYAKTDYTVDLANCIIKGNTVQYVLKDNSIMVYDLDEYGYAIDSTGRQIENVELTKTPLSIFKFMADFADKNDDGFDKKDLKKLDKYDLGNAIVRKLFAEGDYNLHEINVTKNSIHLTMFDTKGNKRNLEVEFIQKKFKDYFKGLFKFNKKEEAANAAKAQPIASIEVGELEENPIDLRIVEEKNTEVEESTLSRREIRKAERKTKREEKFNELLGNDNKFKFKGEIEPEYEYAIKEGETVLKIANDLGIPLSCIKAANPGTIWERLQIGQKITIPERRSVENIEFSSLDDVAEYTGLSKFYIEELLCNIEKNHSTVYDDAKQNGKKSGNYVGTLTVGYGHTGGLLGKYFKDNTEYAKDPNTRFELKRSMEGNSSIIELSKEDAYQILAQDLLNMRAEAEAYFGEAFNEAPQSIQDAIIDVIYNKGVDTGLQGYYTVYKNKEKITKQKETPTRNLYENIINRDYVAAAQNVCYSTKLKGLNKRNLYRVIVATQELSPEERLKVLESLDPYCKEVAETLSTGVRTQVLEAWEKAKNGIFDEFTL